MAVHLAEAAPSDAVRIVTDGRAVAVIASEVIAATGWLDR
jgi:hypothetical protein